MPGYLRLQQEEGLSLAGFSAEGAPIPQKNIDRVKDEDVRRQLNGMNWEEGLQELMACHRQAE